VLISLVERRNPSADLYSAGILLDDEAQSIIGQGHEIKNMKPRKEDIVHE